MSRSLKNIFIIVFALMLISCFLNHCHSKNKENNVSSDEKYAQQREQMIQRQLKARGIKVEKVLDAFRQVKRHHFVPKQYRDEAYDDHPLPIGEGQTISQPYIVAFMTEALHLSEKDKILEVGTGSGYQAAILSVLSDSVYTIEINENLAKRARTTLDTLGYDDVHVKTGDGYKGWEEHAPYDAIIVTAAPTHIPPPLKTQLREGGRMIIPVGEGFAQKLVYLKKEGGKLVQRGEFPVRFVPLIDSTGTRY